MGHWPPHRPHTAVSSVNCVGISPKLKSTCQGQNNISTSFLSIIYDNLYQYQPMMSPVAVDIDYSDFFLPLVKGVTQWSNSPEMLNSGQNRQFLILCDLEIWWMTLKNDRAPPLCHFKPCASFHSHQWIQTGITVPKLPIWVKTINSFSGVTLKFDEWTRQIWGIW